MARETMPPPPSLAQHITSRRFLTESTAHQKRRAASPGRLPQRRASPCGGAGSKVKVVEWTRSRRCSTTSTTSCGPTRRGRGEPLAGGRASWPRRRSVDWPLTSSCRWRSDPFPYHCCVYKYLTSSLTIPCTKVDVVVEAAKGDTTKTRRHDYSPDVIQAKECTARTVR